MKSLLITASLLSISTCCFAEADEEVVKAMTRLTSLSAEEIRRNYDSCDSGVTLSMKICASYNWVVQDVRLNDVYRVALAAAREKGYEASLVKAQRAWLAYRDAACRAEGEMGAGGGTLEGLYVLSCKEELTKQRADRLETMLKTD